MAIGMDAMPSSEILLALLLVSVVLAGVPGPSMLYAVAQTVALGRPGGWWSATGFHVAGLVHTCVAVLGATAVLHAMPQLFLAMQVVGGVYLAWMGARYLLAQPDNRMASSSSSAARSGHSAFSDSVIVELLNPKSYVFFFLFLPQFTEPSASFPVWLQIMILGAVVNLIFTTTDLLSIELSHAAARQAKGSARFTFILQRASGIILVLLGVKVALYGA